MGQFVLGLDLGSYSIKASLFETTFRSYELLNLFESSPLYIEDLDKEPRQEIVVEALQNLISSNNLVPDMIVSALPGDKISTRILHFPFGDNKKIAKILPLELEAHIPFPLEEIVIDYHIVSQKKNVTTIIACAVQKKELAAHLELLDKCGIDPRIVDIDCMSLFNLLNIGDLDKDGCFAILDLGHSKTSLCLVKKGKAHFIRTMFTGGQAITNAIRYDFDLVYQQAEKLKHRHGALELENQPLMTKEMRRVSNSIRQSIDPLVKDVIQTIHAFQSGTHSQDGEKQKVDKILLTGGSSLLPNLAGYIREISDIEVESFSGFANKPDLKNKLGPREPVLQQAISLGLRSAIRGVKREKMSNINLRRGEFAPKQELHKWASNFKKYGSWAAVLLLCFIINISARSYILNKKLDRIEQQIVTTFRQTVSNFPKTQKVSASKAVKIMQARLNKNQERYEVLTAGLKGVTALEILKAISEKIPESITVDISELNISSGKVFLRGETDSFGSVDKIIKALNSYQYFGEVKKGELKDSLDPNKKRFSLSIKIETESQS